MPPRLNKECQITFLKYCIQNVYERGWLSTTEFFKFLLISKNFLSSSRCRHSKAYQFVLCFNNLENTKFIVCPNSSRISLKRYLRSSGFFHSNIENAYRLFRFLMPPFINLSVSCQFNIEKFEEYRQLLSITQSEIAVELFGVKDLSQMQSHLSEYKERIVNLDTFSLSDNFYKWPLPNLKIYACRFLKNMDVLNDVLNGHRVRILILHLSVAFKHNNDNSLSLPSVQELHLDCTYIGFIDHCIESIEFVYKCLPNCRSMTLYIRDNKITKKLAEKGLSMPFKLSDKSYNWV